MHKQQRKIGCKLSVAPCVIQYLPRLIWEGIHLSFMLQQLRSLDYVRKDGAPF